MVDTMFIVESKFGLW